MDKRSNVKRVPIELEQRLADYRIKVFKQEGKLMNDADLMRKFANEAITAYDDAGSALKKLGHYKLIK